MANAHDLLMAQRAAMMGGKKLPYDAEVEYIESTGTQYIDLMMKPSLDIAVDFDVAFTYSSRNWVFGSMDAALNNGIAISFSGEYVYARTRGAFTNRGGIALGDRYNIKVQNKRLYIDGKPAAYGTELVQSDSDFNILIFGASCGTRRNLGNARIYNFRLTNDSTSRTFKFVKVSGEGAVYDTLGVGGVNKDGTPRTDGLYFNRGTGDFGIGPEKT